MNNRDDLSHLPSEDEPRDAYQEPWQRRIDQHLERHGMDDLFWRVLLAAVTELEAHGRRDEARNVFHYFEAIASGGEPHYRFERWDRILAHPPTCR